VIPSGGLAPGPGRTHDKERRVSEIGPVEYAVIAFPGNRFSGEIAPALAELIEAGTIRIIDLAFVGKDADGNVLSFEMTDLEEDVRRALEGVGVDPSGLLNEDDLNAAAEELEADSSALLVVWEDVWATKLAQAVRNADGVILDFERIPHEVVVEARNWILSNT
jgi:hypothetical protein